MDYLLKETVLGPSWDHLGSIFRTTFGTMVLGPPWGVVYHLKDGLLDLGAVLEGGGEGAHGRAGDEGADDAAVALQFQTNHLKEKNIQLRVIIFLMCYIVIF